MNEIRLHRIEKKILVILSEVYKKKLHLSDNVPFLTFSRCELSRDGSSAKVFISIYAEQKEQFKAFKIIKQNTRLFRSIISKNIRMKYIPSLSFYLMPESLLLPH